MPSHDLFSETELKLSIAPQSIAQLAAVNGTGVDRANHESVVIEAQLATASGAPTAGTIDLVPYESDDNVTFTQVGTDKVSALFNAAAGVLRYRYTGIKRYVRARIEHNTTGGTAAAVIAAATVLLGALRFAGKQPGAAPLVN